MKRIAKTSAYAVPAVLGLLLSACVLPPRDTPAVQAIAEDSLGLAGAASPAVPQDWWKAFGDPQLDRLVQDTLNDNPSLAQALTRVQSAQAQAYAAGAGRLPGVTLDGDETRQRFSEHYYIPPPYAGSAVWLGQLGVNLGWDLDFWGRQARLIEQARDQAQAAQLDHAASRLALSGALAQAYVDLYRAHELGAIATAAVRQRETILQLTQNRVRAGLDTEAELHSAEALLPQARSASLQSEAARQLAVHRLAALSGHGAERYDSIVAPQLQLDAALPLPEQLPLDLLARRPDVRAARLRVDAASAGVEAARAAFYPDISLRALIGYQAIGLDKLLDKNSAIWGVGPAVHLPLFEARRLKGAFRGAAAERDAAVAAYNDTVLKAVREAADELTLNDSTAAQLAEARTRATAAEAAYRLSERRYAAGLSSQLQLLGAETQWLDARRELISRQADLAVTRVTLLLTLGGSFDPHTPDHNKTPTVAGVQP